MRAFLVGLFVLWAGGAVAAALPIETWTTTQGSRVLFTRTADLPMFDLEVVLDAGSVRDGELPGLARFTGALLDEGTETLAADAFHDALDETGAQLGAGTQTESANASLRSLSAAEERNASVGLLCDMLAHPRFDVAAIERQRKRMRVALQRLEESPGALGERAFMEALYGDHPLAASPLGTVDSLARIGRADIVAFHARYFVARNALILLVGDLDRATAGDIAERVSNALPAGEPALPVLPVPKGRPGVVRHLEFDSEQTHVFLGQIGMARGDPDYFPLLVANHALGGNGVVSLLFDEIREKRGLSYSVESHFEPMRLAGPFMATLQTRNGQSEEAVKTLRALVATFIAEGPSEAALTAAKQNLIAAFPMRLENNARILDHLAVIGFNHLPLDYLDRFIGNIEAVTPAQIRDALRRRLPPEAMTLITVGRSVSPTP